MSAARERTFLMIKPDGVHRGLVGKIIQRFEEKGFKLVAMKYMWVRRYRHAAHCAGRRPRFYGVL
jgi:nucleoside-diphosphate kinase